MLFFICSYLIVLLEVHKGSFNACYFGTILCCVLLVHKRAQHALFFCYGFLLLPCDCPIWFSHSDWENKWIWNWWRFYFLHFFIFWFCWFCLLILFLVNNLNARWSLRHRPLPINRSTLIFVVDNHWLIWSCQMLIWDHTSKEGCFASFAFIYASIELFMIIWIWSTSDCEHPGWHVHHMLSSTICCCCVVFSCSLTCKECPLTPLNYVLWSCFELKLRLKFMRWSLRTFDLTCKVWVTHVYNISGRAHINLTIKLWCYLFANLILIQKSINNSRSSSCFCMLVDLLSWLSQSLLFHILFDLFLNSFIVWVGRFFEFKNTIIASIICSFT